MKDDLKLAKRLSGKPLRMCMSLHYCELCKTAITMGQFYRDGGYRARAHDACVRDPEVHEAIRKLLTDKARNK